VGYFNGIFQGFLVLTGVAGNLLSSLVFDLDRAAAAAGTDAAASSASGPSDGSSQSAGGGGSTAVPQSTVFLLFALYLVCVVLAIVCATCTLPTTAMVEVERERYGLVVKGAGKLPSLWTTVNIMKQPRMLLILPIFGAMGWIYSFVSADFTKGVIEPVMGERAIGQVMAVFYVACAVVSVSVGRVSDLLGRPAVLCFAALLIFITFGVLKWQPPADSFAVYALAVTIGTGLQSLRTPLAAQMSANYRDDIEAAFAATEMVTSVVGALGYLAATSMSLDMKLNIATATCVVGFGCYYVDASLHAAGGDAVEGGGGAEPSLEARLLNAPAGQRPSAAAATGISARPAASHAPAVVGGGRLYPAYRFPMAGTTTSSAGTKYTRLQ
jgi:hypothetical protein